MKKQKHSKILIVIGTKAELIKCFPIMIELQKQNKDYWFIHTGQHNLEKYYDLFGIKHPDFNLSEKVKKGSKGWSKINFKTLIWNISTMFKIRKLIRKLSPNYVLYHGDTMNTAMAVGAASNILNPLRKNWKSVHLEGGLRSWNLMEPLPEEFIRRVADFFSDIVLTPSEMSKNNIGNNLFSKKIINVGNTILDSVDIVKNNSKRKIKSKKYAIVSIHRYENLKNSERMKKIVDVINSIDIPVYWPLHGNTRKKIEEYGLDKHINKKNIIISDSMNYSDFLDHLSGSSLIVCDGGSIQEESLIFHKPCIIMRNHTERPEGLNSNFQFLSKFDIEKTKEKTKEFLHKDFKVEKIKNPYGKIGVSKNVLEELG